MYEGLKRFLYILMRRAFLDDAGKTAYTAGL